MIRCRFHADYNDPRPIKWPYPHPYWVSGESMSDDPGYSIVIAYADSEAQILEYWPEATELDSEERTKYTYTDRFPRPEWLPTEAPHD